MSEQAKLFGTVVAFPGDPLAPLIRRTARELQYTHGPAADRLWRERCSAAQRAIPGTLEQKQAGVDQFALDVHTELQRLAWNEWHQTHQPGGDAA